jgi:hypothetical protein
MLASRRISYYSSLFSKAPPRLFYNLHERITKPRRSLYLLNWDHN